MRARLRTITETTRRRGMSITRLVCAIALTGSLALVSCDKGDSAGGGAGGGTTGPSGSGGGKGRLIGASFQTMNNPFFVDLDKGLRATVEDNGDRLTTLDAQFNSNKQRSD